MGGRDYVNLRNALEIAQFRTGEAVARGHYRAELTATMKSARAALDAWTRVREREYDLLVAWFRCPEHGPQCGGLEDGGLCCCAEDHRDEADVERMIRKPAADDIVVATS